MLVRENPWHLRKASTEHYKWFENLVELHEITASWLKELQIDRPSYVMTRGFDRSVADNLWMLDSLATAKLENFLDERQPGEMLVQLDRTVWAAQSWTLASLLEKTPKADVSALDSLLEQTGWKLGRKCAETRWPQLVKGHQEDLRHVLLALGDSPFSGYPSTEGFLIRRLTAAEAQIELRSCPHHSPYPEVRSVADQLCRLHGQWLRGFAYALNNKVSVEHQIHSPRCLQRWFFVA